jgi:very-short-patch-repair endonuclease
MPITKKPRKKLKKQITLELLERAGVFYSKKLILNATKWELKIKKMLDVLGAEYIFQHPIICNKKKLYILDFYFPKTNIALEIDGAQYHTTPEQKKKDNLRTRRLKKEGIIVRRLTNRQVNYYTERSLNQILQIFINARI